MTRLFKQQLISLAKQIPFLQNISPANSKRVGRVHQVLACNLLLQLPELVLESRSSSIT